MAPTVHQPSAPIESLPSLSYLCHSNFHHIIIIIIIIIISGRICSKRARPGECWRPSEYTINQIYPFILAKVKLFNRLSNCRLLFCIISSYSFLTLLLTALGLLYLLASHVLGWSAALGDRLQQPARQESKTLSNAKLEPLTLPKTNMAMENPHFQ